MHPFRVILVSGIVMGSLAFLGCGCSTATNTTTTAIASVAAFNFGPVGCSGSPL